MSGGFEKRFRVPKHTGEFFVTGMLTTANGPRQIQPAFADIVENSSVNRSQHARLLRFLLWYWAKLPELWYRRVNT